MKKLFFFLVYFLSSSGVAYGLTFDNFSQLLSNPQFKATERKLTAAGYSLKRIQSKLCHDNIGFELTECGSINIYYEKEWQVSGGWNADAKRVTLHFKNGLVTPDPVAPVDASLNDLQN